MLHKLSFKTPLKVYRKGEGSLPADLKAIASYLKPLANVEEFSQRNLAPAAGEAVLVIDGDEFILPLKGLIDLSAERERLRKELGNHEAELGKIDNLLANAGFVAKAPPAVLEQNRERQATLRDGVEKIRALLNGPYAG